LCTIDNKQLFIVIFFEYQPPSQWRCRPWNIKFNLTLRLFSFDKTRQILLEKKMKIFPKNWNFGQKLTHLAKILFVFCFKKSHICGININLLKDINFAQKSKFSAKRKYSTETRNFGQKIEILAKNPTFSRKYKG